MTEEISRANDTIENLNGVQIGSRRSNGDKNSGDTIKPINTTIEVEINNDIEHRQQEQQTEIAEKKRGFCGRISKWERILSIICFIALICCLIIIFTSENISSYKSIDRIAELNAAENMQEICYTPECIHTASMVLGDLNTTVDPCQDFYQFSCGNYLQKHTIDDDKTQYNIFMEIDDLLKKQLKLLIAEKQNENLPKAFKLANKFYQTCMNTDLIEKIGLSQIKERIELLGGWPVVTGDSWKESEWDWMETIFKSRNLNLGINFIVAFDVSIDFTDNSKRIIDIDQPTPGLSREYLIEGFDNRIVASYYKLMVDTAVYFGANRARAETEMREALEFEIQLSKNSWSIEQRRNFTAVYNPMTIQKLSEKYPYIDWLNYVNKLLPKDIQVQSEDMATVGVIPYFDKLDLLLKRTPKRTVANYLIWRIVNHVSGFLNADIRNLQLELTKVSTGQATEQERWKECIEITQANLEISVSALYVRKYFKESSKAKALEMVNEIRSVFEKTLTEVNWMDDETRKAALKKLKKMTTHIGYPDELQDNQKLEEYYKDLEIDSDQYLYSFLNISKFTKYKTYSKLRKMVNNSDWETHSDSAIVNAYYNAIENSIQFPAGILQSRFFNADRPKYMNFGAIGFIIGHEITHGFDNQGRQFDEKGNLVNWWQENTQKLFLEKAQCVTDQFSNYTDKSTGLKISGTRTQGENVADGGGGKQSYLAYMNWVKKNGKEPLLPGLKYTQNQLFWISVAQNWCSLYKTAYLENLITTDVHPPAEARVIGTVSNMKDFSKDFNCPVGSPMNPEQKCEVW